MLRRVLVAITLVAVGFLATPSTAFAAPNWQPPQVNLQGKVIIENQMVREVTLYVRNPNTTMVHVVIDAKRLDIGPKGEASTDAAFSCTVGGVDVSWWVGDTPSHSYFHVELEEPCTHPQQTRTNTTEVTPQKLPDTPWIDFGGSPFKLFSIFGPGLIVIGSLLIGISKIRFRPRLRRG